MNRAPGTMIQRNSGEESLTAIRSPVLTGPGSCGVFLFLENSIPIRPTGFCNVNELFEVNSEQARVDRSAARPRGRRVRLGRDARRDQRHLGCARRAARAQSLALEGGPDEYYRGRLALAHTRRSDRRRRRRDRDA